MSARLDRSSRRSHRAKTGRWSALWSLDESVGWLGGRLNDWSRSSVGWTSLSVVWNVLRVSGLVVDDVAQAHF